jgi:hypothetical protein
MATPALLNIVHRPTGAYLCHNGKGSGYKLLTNTKPVAAKFTHAKALEVISQLTEAGYQGYETEKA